MVKKILAKTQGKQKMESTEKLLAKMMAFKPVTAEVDRVNALVDFMKEYLRRAGLYVKIEKMGRRKILYAARRRTKVPALLMNAHLDVVPAEDKLFCLRRQGAWLYGRGTNDCLGCCAVLTQALIAARSDADVGVMFSTDEETGGETVKHMVARGYGGKFVVVVDGGGYSVTTAQKGILALRMRAEGKACHSSTPWKGDNAVDRLITAYLKVKKLFPPVREGDEWHNTLSANIIQAGTVFNRVPEKAEMVLDIRYTEKVKPDNLIRKLRRLTGLAFEPVTESPLMFSRESSPVVAGLREFMRRSLKHEISMTRMNGATDARHFQCLKVPTAIIGLPGDGSHGSAERIHAANTLKYQDMLRDFFNTHAG